MGNHDNAKEVTGLMHGQQMEHVATVVPSVKRDTYVGNAKGKGLLASFMTMVHPSGVETTTEWLPVI